MKSSLNYQTRCISIFADNQGFAMGSIEGRIALEYYNELPQKMAAQQQKLSTAKPPGAKSFVFKFHRDGQDVYAVNSIDFNNKNTFVTAGSDGVFAVWDKEARQRLSLFELHKKRCPITCAKFSPMGNMLFYSLSYDWSKGAENNSPALGNAIAVHAITDAEVTPKPAAGGVGRR